MYFWLDIKINLIKRLQVSLGFITLFKRESSVTEAPDGGEIEKTIDGSLSGWKDGIDHFFKTGIQVCQGDFFIHCHIDYNFEVPNSH